MSDMTTIKQQIRQARPKLKDVSPLAAAIVVGFGIMNIVLGLGLITSRVRTVDLMIINQFTTYEVWGVIFAAVGLASLIGFAVNSWKTMRVMLVIGVFLKMWWLAALAIRLFAGHYDNILFLSLWGMLAFVQVMTYIHFIPARKGKN